MATQILDQQRHLVVMLAELERKNAVHTLSTSPTMSANNSVTLQSALYPNLHQAAAASALSSQWLASRQAAAFLGGLPFFSQNPELFNTWAAATTHSYFPTNLGIAPHSPPASPNSPVNNSANLTPKLNKHCHDQISQTHEINVPIKRARKSNPKKESPSTAPIDAPLTVRSDIYHTPTGLMSPPSSGSSPNSPNDSATPIKDPKQDKLFTCSTCQRSFGYKHVLQNHERTHTGEKPFECQECHKRFTRDHHLKTHMRLHTGEKPYHCIHCDKQFVQVANLRRHLRVHTGERPYTCEICDGKYSDSNQLKSHMMQHNGEKPYECERCHAKFRRNHHFLKHKCGLQSPPTPALSPTMSADYALCDQKSVMGSSYGSEESIEEGRGVKSMAHHFYENIEHTEAPLDLTEDVTMTNVDSLRKVHDIRRFLCYKPQKFMHMHSDLPEQTEPEDLSMHLPRSAEQCRQSTPEPMVDIMDNELGSGDFENAEMLYLRHQQEQNLPASCKRFKVDRG